MPSAKSLAITFAVALAAVYVSNNVAAVQKVVG